MSFNFIQPAIEAFPPNAGHFKLRANPRACAVQPDHAGPVRKDLPVSRQPIPSSALVIEAEEPSAATLSRVSRNLMPSKRLISEGVRIGVAAESGGERASKDLFDEALLGQPSIGRRRRPADWLVSLGIHAAVLASLLTAPLLYTYTLDLRRPQLTYLEAPPMPAARPLPLLPPTAPSQGSPQQSLDSAKLTMPLAIPKAVQTFHADSGLPPENTSGVGWEVGGIPGGQAGSFLAGTFGGRLSEGQPASPALPTESAESQPLHVGGKIKRPQILFEPSPDYPQLALAFKIQGTVEIDAVIGKDGKVAQARAVSGPPELISAALKAVAQWKYAPTYVNGKPYPVDLTVHCTFILGA